MGYVILCVGVYYCVFILNASTTVGCSVVFFFNDTATTEIYTRSLVGSVRCV